MARAERYPGQRSLERMIRKGVKEMQTLQRESMTVPEVQAAIRKVVRDRLERDGEDAVIGMETFQQANLPAKLVDPAFVRSVITTVRSEMREKRA